MTQQRAQQQIPSTECDREMEHGSKSSSGVQFVTQLLSSSLHFAPLSLSLPHLLLPYNLQVSLSLAATYTLTLAAFFKYTEKESRHKCTVRARARVQEREREAR